MKEGRQKTRNTAVAGLGLWLAIGLHLVIVFLFVLRGDHFFRPDSPAVTDTVVRLIAPIQPPPAPAQAKPPVAKKQPPKPPVESVIPTEDDIGPCLANAIEDDGPSPQAPSEPEAAPAELVESPPPLSAQLPRSGEIRMQAYLGRYQLDSEPLGLGSLSVRFPEEDRYEIRLSAQAQGWAALFVREELRFYSQGRLTIEGLMPEAFESYTPFRGQTRSSFDLLTGQAFLGAGREGVPLPEAFQDRLSVIFQLAWIGQNRPGALDYGARHTLTVAGTRDFRATTFTVEGPDDLVLPGGILVSAVRLISDQVSGGRREGQIEVWLDPSDRFLPARILFRENSGQAVDFLAIRAVF
ncbi:MAG: DUF3108 domain-containing protein [Burkholderiaceae bacterium]